MNMIFKWFGFDELIEPERETVVIHQSHEVNEWSMYRIILNGGIIDSVNLK